MQLDYAIQPRSSKYNITWDERINGLFAGAIDSETSDPRGVFSPPRGTPAKEVENAMDIKISRGRTLSGRKRSRRKLN